MTQISVSVSLKDALRFWLRLGFISFGGPAGQITVMHRTWGGVVAGALFVLPSLLLLIFLSGLYMAFGAVPAMAAVLWGIKPAVAAIVLQAVHRMASKVLKNPLQAPVLPTLAAMSFIALTFFHVPFPWVVPMAALVRWQGWHSTLVQMGWFFTKAALLTFGDACAVLPYVVQGAVDHFGWLSAAQMMDGLALGETTPGHLIMVVTWFTFLPSFIFVLAGGPLVESTHGKLQFTAPLAAISAAVVGMMASLALFLIAHIAILTGATSRFLDHVDYAALLLTTLAELALLRAPR